MRYFIFYFLLLNVVFLKNGFANSYFPVEGKSFLSNQEIKIESVKKILVVVFLSAKCPCSNSHVEELIDLKKTYPEFDFIGVHSNLDEPENLSQSYFKSKSLNFDVIQDVKLRLADQWKAYKTPHAFVMNSKGEVLYQGGVSNRAQFSSKNELFLRDALLDIHNGISVRRPLGRTLGCVISRYQ